MDGAVVGIGVGLGVFTSAAGGVAPGARLVSGVGVGSGGSAVGATGKSPGMGNTGVGVGVASEAVGFGSQPTTINEATPIREKSKVFISEESHLRLLSVARKVED